MRLFVFPTYTNTNLLPLDPPPCSGSRPRSFITTVVEGRKFKTNSQQHALVCMINPCSVNVIFIFNLVDMCFSEWDQRQFSCLNCTIKLILQSILFCSILCHLSSSYEQNFIIAWYYLHIKKTEQDGHPAGIVCCLAMFQLYHKACLK